MEWRAIPGFEGRYEASDEGQIRRIGAGRGVVSGRILIPTPLPAGYLAYSLWTGNSSVGKLGHVLVAAAFLGLCPPGQEVNHKNLHKADNRPANLEYLTRSGNLLHRAAAGIGRGSSNAAAKLEADQVLAIRRRAADGEGYKALGKVYGVSWNTIRQIVKRRTWDWLEDSHPDQ